MLAVFCVTTAVGTTTVSGAEQNLVNTALTEDQETTAETPDVEAGEKKETMDASVTEEDGKETEQSDQTTGDTASELPTPAAETPGGESGEVQAAVQTGSYYPWVKEDGIWHFKDPDGTVVKGEWREYDNNRYYLEADGTMAVGWKNMDGSWYYFQSWGGVYRDTFYIK